MIELQSVSKPINPFESRKAADITPRSTTQGAGGAAPTEPSRSVLHLVAKGKSGPIRPPFETVIDRDDRVRILDTELYPWRMICALHMRGPNGAGAIGTGWFIGPKTVVTAGHCVFSNYFFGGRASTNEILPAASCEVSNPHWRTRMARQFGGVKSRDSCGWPVCQELRMPATISYHGKSRSKLRGI